MEKILFLPLTSTLFVILCTSRLNIAMLLYWFRSKVFDGVQIHCLGFTGDGKQCVVARPAAATCERNPSICHAQAHCVYRQEQRGFICECKQGYAGNGYDTCQLEGSLVPSAVFVSCYAW